MCCHRCVQSEKEFLTQMKRANRKTFVAYKILYPNGESLYSSQKYHPGVNVPNKLNKNYRTESPTGIHVYMIQSCLEYRIEKFDNQKKKWVESHISLPGYDQVVVRVICHIDDIIRISSHLDYAQQAVLRKITIRKKDWIEARLPRDSTKRRK